MSINFKYICSEICVIKPADYKYRKFNYSTLIIERNIKISIQLIISSHERLSKLPLNGNLHLDLIYANDTFPLLHFYIMIQREFMKHILEKKTFGIILNTLVNAFLKSKRYLCCQAFLCAFSYKCYLRII